MNHWTIRKRITFGFAAILLLFAAVAVTSKVMLKTVKQHQQAVVGQFGFRLAVGG